MFDTMTLTKTVGAVCGTLLIFLFAKMGADAIYGGGGGHGDHAQAYVVDTGEDDGHAEEEAVVEVAFADVLAGADAGKGEKIFGKCKACHKIDGSNGTGPALNGVVDRAVGGVDGFGYSGDMAAFGGTWTPELLNDFLTKPKDVMSGTKMSFAGLKKINDRANLVAYLQTLN